jgi:hypothetical protein
MDKYWHFKVFVSEETGNEINAWLDNLSDQERKAKDHKARIKRIIFHLENTKDMRSKWFASYENHPHIYRLKFRFHTDIYRVFGVFGPGQTEFTLLIPVQKVAGRLVPRNAVEIAERRYELIKSDRRYIDDFV